MSLDRDDTLNRTEGDSQCIFCGAELPSPTQIFQPKEAGRCWATPSRQHERGAIRATLCSLQDVLVSPVRLIHSVQLCCGGLHVAEGLCQT